MSRYKVEIWPPAPTAGMLTGRMPTGVKVTDTETGRSVCCNAHRSQHMNRDAAIAELRRMDDDCIYCHGDGMDPAASWLLPCPHCDGTGGELLGHDDYDDDEHYDDDGDAAMAEQEAP